MFAIQWVQKNKPFSKNISNWDYILDTNRNTTLWFNTQNLKKFKIYILVTSEFEFFKSVGKQLVAYFSFRLARVTSLPANVTIFFLSVFVT